MKFADILGHDDVKARLREMVDNDRLPHALLLEGPPGVGKLQLAHALVQYNNCSNRTPQGEPCGTCPACIQTQNFNQIDTFHTFPVVKPEGSATAPISDDYLEEWKRFVTSDPYVDFDTWSAVFGPKAKPVIYVTESNNLIHRLSFNSHGVRYKTVILWLPERMNEETANKLLKLIEEPYRDTLIVMVSNDSAAILPTIYSRLQRIEVKRLPDNLIEQWLLTQGATPAEAPALAQLAEGTIHGARRALKAGADMIKYLDLFKELMRRAWGRQVGALKKWSLDVDALGPEREIRFYAYCSRLIRENFVYNFGVAPLNRLTADEASFSTNFARFITDRNVEEIITLFDNAARDIAGKASGKIVNFDVAVKMIMLLIK